MVVADKIGPSEQSKFWRDGYLVIRDVFSATEVAKYRAEALRLRSSAADLLSSDVFRTIILNPSVLAIARRLLEEEPIYFTDSNFWVGTQVAEYHKDNADRYEATAPDWAVVRYPLIRFGLYTEPHGDLPDGLDLRVGSHNYPDRTTGTEVSPAVEPGDLVVWNMRTTHSACSHILKVIGYRVTPQSLLPRVLKKFTGNLAFRKHPQERVAFFFAYAGESSSLSRYIAYLKTRHYAVEGWKASEWSRETKDMIAEAGLKVLDMTGYVPPAEAPPPNVQHVPLPH